MRFGKKSYLSMNSAFRDYPYTSYSCEFGVSEEGVVVVCLLVLYDLLAGMSIAL